MSDDNTTTDPQLRSPDDASENWQGATQVEAPPVDQQARQDFDSTPPVTLPQTPSAGRNNPAPSIDPFPRDVGGAIGSPPAATQPLPLSPAPLPPPPGFTGFGGAPPVAATPPFGDFQYPGSQPAPSDGAQKAGKAGRDRKGPGWPGVIAASAIAALLGAGIAVPTVRALDGTGGTAAPAATVADNVGDTTQSPIITGDNTIARVARTLEPAVAYIEVSGPTGRGSGSAIVFRQDGYLITNNHVVASGGNVTVTLSDGSVHPARIIGTDEFSDLAVVKIEQTGLTTPSFADNPPDVGETAVAIGSPFGLQGSVTAGIVSSLNRSIDTPGAPLIDVIQTDAAINPGNSGGALANLAGRVIGINTAIFSSTGANNGIGFAIPITTALPIAEQLVDNGFVSHAQLGIRGQDLSGQSGAFVFEVIPGTAADRAGLVRGDIITAIGGEQVDSMAQLAARIRRFAPGDETTLSVTGNDGTERQVNVTFDEAPPTRSQNG